MARIRGHKNLREDQPLYVLKAELTAGGETFVLGDEFPWQRIAGVTPRLLKLLHEQRKIGHDRPAAPPKGAEDPPRSPQEQVRAEARDKGRAGGKPEKAASKPAGARMG